jgi:DNA-binding IclR family transcriptional regulator
MKRLDESNLSGESGRMVPAIRRALAVFDLLAASRRELSLSDVSRALDLPKASVYRILTTLLEEECVHRSLQSGRFSLGRKLMGLSQAAIDGSELRRESLPFLTGLSQRTGFTVHMAVLQNHQAVLVAKVEPLGQSVGTWVGRAMDLHSTGAGKALICRLPPSEIADQFKTSYFVRHNSRTIATMASLLKDLESACQRGYTVDNEEDELAMRCIGAPVEVGGRTLAAISVVGSAGRLGEERVPSLGPVVAQTAAAIAGHIGIRRHSRTCKAD